MIGVVLVTHGHLGKDMIQAAETITGESLDIKNVVIGDSKDANELRRKIKETLILADTGQGVLALTDLFGGTPSNICISLMDELDIEVVSGVNLPMLIKISYIGSGEKLKDVAVLLQDYGKKNISVASGILEQGVPK